MSSNLPDSDQLNFPVEIRVSQNSGFFGNWNFLSDEEKAELNEMASQKMKENNKINKILRDLSAKGMLDPTIYLN